MSGWLIEYMAQRHGAPLLLARRLKDVLLSGELRAHIRLACSAATDGSRVCKSSSLGSVSRLQFKTLLRDADYFPTRLHFSLPFRRGFDSTGLAANAVRGGYGHPLSLVANYGRQGMSSTCLFRSVATAECCSQARASSSGTGVGHSQGINGSSAAEKLTRKSQLATTGKSQSMFMYLMAMVVAVFGVTYASVPLYRRFCQATGYGGTVQRRQTVEEKIASHDSESTVSRELVVHFNADVADSMPWKFTPCQSQVKVKVGESALAFYTAENTSSEDITGVSTYNVAPMQ